MNLKTKRPITSERYTEKQKSWNWKVLLKLLATGLAIYFVSRKIDFNEIVIWIGMVPWVMTAGAILLFNVSKIAGAYRLNLFFRAESVRLSEIDNLKLYYIGMFYNLFLPGGIGGDGYKVYHLNKFRGYSVKEVLKPVLWDRISGAVAILFTIILLISFLSLPNHIQFVQPLLIVIALLIFPTFYVITFFLFPAYRPIFASTSLLALGIQVVQAMVAFSLFWCLDVPFLGIPEYLAVFFVSSLVTIIPITIGGVGVREFVFIVAAQYTSVQQNQAVAFSVVFFFITAISSLSGAFLNVSDESQRV